MATHGRAVRFTANFERNLEEIRSFLTEQESADSFVALMTALIETVIPNLKRFPEMGRDFLERVPQSEEGRVRWGEAEARAATRRIREYIAGDYLILYAVSDDAIGLLSIKHHRQLSFDLKSHWT